jgi:hypothetical protein
MKITELKIGQGVIINGFKYTYKGINKIRMNGGWAQKILFKSSDKHPDKHFDITLGNKDIKALKIEIAA